MDSDNKDKRVILINGDGKKWFDQAIFIVRKGIPDSGIPTNIIYEAERIVNSFMDSKGRATVVKAATKPQAAIKKRSRKREIFVNLAMIDCCAVLAVMVYRLSMS